jgi:hypothetical protein
MQYVDAIRQTFVAQKTLAPSEQSQAGHCEYRQRAN